MTKGWPEGEDPVSRELRRAFDEARLRGPDEVTLRRGWTSLAEMLARRSPIRPKRWPNLVVFAGGVALTVACAALLWPRSVESPAGELAAGKRPAAPAVASGEDPGVRVLTLDGGVRAQLGSSSVMRLEAGDPRVEGGEVKFSVPRRQPGRPFVVRADRYRVVVIGTRFGVAVDDRRNVAIDVKEGVVEVWGEAGRLARLVPGDSWRSPEPSAEQAAAPEGGTAIPAPEQATPATAGRSRASASTKRAVALATPGGSRPLAAGSSAGPTAGPADGSAAPAGDPAIAARAALASGDAARALQISRAAAQRSGPAAENAAYEVGKILSDRMGQPANAVAAWRRYRATYPEGILRLEADVSIIETLARMGEADEALAEATDFLRRHPDSERRGEIARVAGDLYRARGDCRRAIGAYQVALGAARPRDAAESAAFHRAECLVRVGDATGPDAARGYLRAYPAGRFRSEASALAANGGQP